MASEPKYIANFDSAASMVEAISRYLHGKSMPAMGMMPRSISKLLTPVAHGISALPRPLKEQLYAWSGWNEAINEKDLHTVRADEIRKWVTDLYPKKKYQTVCIGSSGGASTHLACLLGAPWLPQTFLVPVRRHGVHPDEPYQDVAWGLEQAPKLLENNPDLQLHHMHDPNQDRLMVRHMSYFRVKLRSMGKPYEDFLKERLEPGGTIVVVESGLKWPTTKLDERYYFQHGALGGATKKEFHQGSERVAEYLERYDSHRRRWVAPVPDGNRPEAEWGFEPSLRDDVERFAEENGYKVRRVTFGEPETFSPFVADLYRWWYRERGLRANRLVVESFALLDPYRCVRTGSVPFWMTFNKEPSAEAIENYLDSREDFDEIGMMLFSHGVNSVGLVPMERWEAVLDRARKRGFFIGVNKRAYPRDFAAFLRYHTHFYKEISAKYPMPGPMHLSTLDRFIDEYGDRYDEVQWHGVGRGRTQAPRLEDEGRAQTP